MNNNNPITLAACPPGLFRFNGTLGFKSEYRDDLGCVEAFVVESGEAFWGGTTDRIVRDKLLVVPVSEYICFRHGDGEGLAKAVVEEYDKWLTAGGNRLREGERLAAIIQRTCFPQSEGVEWARIAANEIDGWVCAWDKRGGVEKVEAIILNHAPRPTAAREDTARLDWLEKNGGGVEFRKGSGFKWNVFDKTADIEEGSDASLRAAIDAAMQQGGKTP